MFEAGGPPLLVSPPPGEAIEDLPRKPTGKVQRYGLREAEQMHATLAGTG